MHRQSRFLLEHLAQWAPDYCAALAVRSENSYVQAIAWIAASTLRADVDALEETIQEVDHIATQTSHSFLRVNHEPSF